MIIANAILQLSSTWYIILSFNQCFIIKILPYWFVAKNIENYRKYYIFFNFRFTENIFSSIAENQDNMIFTLSVFMKMLFFMQCYVRQVFQNFLHSPLSKIAMYEFWYDYVKTKVCRKIKIMLYGYRQLYSLHKNVIYMKMIFIKTLQKMLRQDLILQTMNKIDHYLKEKRKSFLVQ